MEKAVKDAIRAGGIRDLPFEQQILVARALIILSKWPDAEANLPKLDKGTV